MIVEVKSVDDLVALPTPAVVVVTDPATCAPCRAFAPHFEAAANKAADKVTFAKITMSELDDFQLISDLGVQSVPTTFLMQNYGNDDIFASSTARLESRTSVGLLKDITALTGIEFE